MLKLPIGGDEELEFKEYINQKLYKMPINSENKDFVDSIFETVYGESIQDFMSKEIAEKMQAEKVRAAQKLLSKGFSMEDVAEVYNMTLEEIKEITTE